MITKQELDNWFRFHPASDPKEAAKHLAPSCADQTAAIRKVREAMFTACAAIACGRQVA
jgi:hypothetical protein